LTAARERARAAVVARPKPFHSAGSLADSTVHHQHACLGMSVEVFARRGGGGQLRCD
jgi:hypothetical protein